MSEITCFGPPPPDGCPPADQAESYYGPCTWDGYFVEAWIDGPFTDNGECCYEVISSSDFCGVGRPYTEAGQGIVAQTKAGERGWLAEIGPVDVAGVSDDERAQLAASWRRDGLLEHASVAAFSRLSLELMAVAAPPDLLSDVHAAALDEIAHAELCFAIAARIDGHDAGPGGFPMSAETVRGDLAEVAAAAAREGCIDETLAAAMARRRAELASEPEIARALHRIADDEERHAELSWRIVRWALSVGGDDVRAAVRDVFAGAAGGHLAGDDVSGDGRIAAKDAARLQQQVLADVVIPCAAALFARS